MEHSQRTRFPSRVPGTSGGPEPRGHTRIDDRFEDIGNGRRISIPAFAATTAVFITVHLPESDPLSVGLGHLHGAALVDLRFANLPTRQAVSPRRAPRSDRGAPASAASARPSSAASPAD